MTNEVWSEHALQRAKERFDGVDIKQLYRRAGRIKKKARKKYVSYAQFLLESG